MEEMLKLAKLACSVSESSTVKDEEFKMLISAAQLDMERLDIKIDLNNKLIQQAIVLYVKGYFGNTDIKEKERAIERYSSLCDNLRNSLKYRMGVKN